MKLYWNDRFTDCIYCVHGPYVYKLGPSFDKLANDEDIFWTETEWDIEFLAFNGFKYMGQI